MSITVKPVTHRREAQEGGDMCVIMAYLISFMAENNTSLLSWFSPINNKKIKLRVMRKKKDNAKW